MSHQELDQVFGEAEAEPTLAITSGYAICITGESKPTAVEAGRELGECSTLPNFLFGYVDEEHQRAVVFLQDEPDAPPPLSDRMKRVRFVLGPTFLQGA